MEVNVDAVKRARDSGVKIVGENVYLSEKNLSIFFDVVTAFDIIEHMEDPMNFLARLIEHTRPGGRILIGTGNTDTWTWKLAKNRYYYCWISEHISFVNRAWFEHQAKELHYEIRDMQKFSHGSLLPVIGVILQSVANILYLFVPSVFYRLRLCRWKLTGKLIDKIIERPPAWSMSRGHFGVVLQKIPSLTIGDSN